jgi:aryl-alcohol dehydrogenase-like predicted oxidoreductase
METRPFGKTGESFPILGFGGQRIVDEHGCTEADAIEIVNTAIDRGIRYFDTAWVYSRGQAETRLGKVAGHRRPEMWIATKTLETARDDARRQLEESLNRLQTDYVDEWRLHNIFDKPRLDAFTGKDGALQAAIEARREGLVRFISISGHTDPQLLVEALNRYPFDSALIPVSALDHFKLSFVDEFLPVANERKVGTIGMKILALGALNHDVRRALRYCFSLPLSIVVIGMESLNQLEQNLAIAESHVPMGEAEKQAFFEDIKSLVRPDKLPWKSDDENNPTRWARRGEIFAPSHRQEGILKTFLRQFARERLNIKL